MSPLHDAVVDDVGVERGQVEGGARSAAAGAPPAGRWVSCTGRDGSAEVVGARAVSRSRRAAAKTVLRHRPRMSKKVRWRSSTEMVKAKIRVTTRRDRSTENCRVYVRERVKNRATSSAGASRRGRRAPRAAYRQGRIPGPCSPGPDHVRDHSRVRRRPTRTGTGHVQASRPGRRPGRRTRRGGSAPVVARVLLPYRLSPPPRSSPGSKTCAAAPCQAGGCCGRQRALRDPERPGRLPGRADRRVVGGLRYDDLRPEDRRGAWPARPAARRRRPAGTPGGPPRPRPRSTSIASASEHSMPSNAARARCSGFIDSRRSPVSVPAVCGSCGVRSPSRYGRSTSPWTAGRGLERQRRTARPDPPCPSSSAVPRSVRTALRVCTTGRCIPVASANEVIIPAGSASASWCTAITEPEAPSDTTASPSPTPSPNAAAMVSPVPAEISSPSGVVPAESAGPSTSGSAAWCPSASSTRSGRYVAGAPRTSSRCRRRRRGRSSGAPGGPAAARPASRAAA